MPGCPARTPSSATVCPSSSASQAWRESGFGAPAVVEQLKRRVSELEQHAAEDAARAANRELMAQLNRLTPTRAAGLTARTTPVAHANVVNDGA